MGRRKGSKNKPKAIDIVAQEAYPPLSQEIQSLLEQKRKLPAGSQERVSLHRRIKELQLRQQTGGSNALEKVNTNTGAEATLQIKKDEAPTSAPNFPDIINNDCPLRTECLKENKKNQSFTCYNSVYYLNQGCNFCKERING